MSVLVSLSVKAKPENADELKRWFIEEAPHTRMFEGCRSIRIHADADDPNHVFVLGEWDSRQHHQNYLAWRTDKGDVDHFMAWLADAPVSYYFDGTPM